MKNFNIKVSLLLLILLAFDQAVKIIVKTNMTIDQMIPVFNHWFYIRFIENPGAALGFQLGGDYGKIILSLFRIAAVIALGYYIGRLHRKKAPAGVIVGFVLILAGAFGNIIDSAFYGMIFSESTYTTVAQFVPWGSGYAPFLHGHVVDMLYFPLISGYYPSWLPWIGGNPFIFFSPIFNAADSYITIGVIYLILFQRKFFK